MLFSDEEDKEAQFGVQPVDTKVESAKVSSELGRAELAEEAEKVGFFHFLLCLGLLCCNTHTYTYPSLYFFPPLKIHGLFAERF